MKTLTTDRNPKQKPATPQPVVPRTWEEFSRVYPIYEALAKQCGLPGGPYPARAPSGQWPDKKDRDLQWLDEVDRQAQAVHLRRLLATPAAASEEGLRLLLWRQLCKRQKQRTDRDKIDLLTVQYFVLCVPQDLIAGPVDASDVARVLRPVLGEVKPAPLECSEALNRILDLAQQCRSLRDLMEQGLLEQGRLVKEAVEEAFYDSTVLIWVCRFNFLLRRTFIEWLHADLRAIGVALRELEKREVKSVDCRRAGLSAAEPLAMLRQFHERWRPPVQTDYSQDSAFRPYEQLMSLREDLEEALGPVEPPPFIPPSPEPPEVNIPNIEPKAQSPRIEEFSVTPTPEALPAKACSVSPPAKSQSPVTPAKQDVAAAKATTKEKSSPADQNIPATGDIDIDTLEEKIWEQLIATPPARGRSMTTVTVDNSRILLSAWEVAAFVSESGNDSEELRRVIVARAVLSMAIERRKRLMDLKMLKQAVTHARREIPRFQERVDQFKRDSKTDGAVNLGISLKRLLSLIEEAEQLQKGNQGHPEKR
jgi:hypothetical protein